MTNARRIPASLSAVLVSLALAGGPALAQDDAVISEQDERQTLTDDLIGMAVYSRNPDTEDRENIGRIDSLLLNDENQVTGVVISVGGFIGFGAKSVALDWDAVEVEQFGQTGFVANVEITREDLEAAPAFKTLAEKEAEEDAERAQQQMEQQQSTGTGGTGTGGTGTGTTQ